MNIRQMQNLEGHSYTVFSAQLKTRRDHAWYEMHLMVVAQIS
jgi:hypothetical protein